MNGSHTAPHYCKYQFYYPTTMMRQSVSLSPLSAQNNGYPSCMLHSFFHNFIDMCCCLADMILRINPTFFMFIKLDWFWNTYNLIVQSLDSWWKLAVWIQLMDNKTIAHFDYFWILHLKFNDEIENWNTLSLYMTIMEVIR